jgi:hypothetical protein
VAFESLELVFLFYCHAAFGTYLWIESHEQAYELLRHVTCIRTFPPNYSMWCHLCPLHSAGYATSCIESQTGVQSLVLPASALHVSVLELNCPVSKILALLLPYDVLLKPNLTSCMHIHLHKSKDVHGNMWLRAGFVYTEIREPVPRFDGFNRPGQSITVPICTRRVMPWELSVSHAIHSAYEQELTCTRTSS